jgi:hypothetical protein
MVNLWVLVFLVAAVSSGQAQTAGAQAPLVANAGPDETVAGPNPVQHVFWGVNSTGDIVSYKCYNQWGVLRAEGKAPVIEVNFGKNPRIGTKRTFTLVVTDSKGNTAKDTVTVTFGGTDPMRVGAKSALGVALTLQERGKGYTGALQTIELYELTYKNGVRRWYVSSDEGSDDLATIKCHEGTYWEVFSGIDNTDAFFHREGCLGDGPVGPLHLVNEGSIDPEGSLVIGKTIGEEEPMEIPLVTITPHTGLEYDLFSINAVQE